MKIGVVVSAALTLLLSAACTDCRDRILQHAVGESLIADVHERICGSAAGLTVRVFSPGTPERDGDALQFEPFQAKCPPAQLQTVFVSAQWLDANRLEVRHSPALTILRAETQWKNVAITYVAQALQPTTPH
jgi:hypothetical protein